MKRILLIVPISSLTGQQGNTGGVDSVCQSILREMVTRNTQNCHYTLLAFNPLNSLSADENGTCIQLAENIHAYQYNMNAQQGYSKHLPGFLYRWCVIRKLINQIRPDLVHVHLISFAVAALGKAKAVATLHAYNHISKKSNSLSAMLNRFFYLRLMDPISMKAISEVSVVSEWLRKNVAADHKLPISVIYNPINPDYFVSRSKQVSAHNSIKLVTCALLTPGKNIETLLHITHRLIKSGREVQLDIIGPASNTAYVETLKTLAAQLNIVDCINFKGPMHSREISQLYQTADIGVFLSLQETFGLVPVEMLCSGLPVIASRTGVMPELEEKQIAGLAVVEPMDIEKAITHIEQFHQQGIAVDTTRVQQLFSTPSIVTQYEALCQRHL